MNCIKKAYNYLFYKLYRFFEFKYFSVWWSEYKAATLLSLLFFILILSIYTIYMALTNQNINLLSNKRILIIIMLLICGLNYYCFNHKDKWKKIVEKFDKLPQIKNRIGSWLVFLFIVVIFVSFFFAADLIG